MQINNRELRFRVWDKKKNKYLNPTNRIKLTLGGKVTKAGEWSYAVDKNCIVQQYAGLKDKNRKKIYEGDILKCINRTADPYVKVEFENGCFMIEKRIFRDFTGYNDIEIVGNIMENPDLLK